MEIQRLATPSCREEVMDDFSRPIQIKKYKFRYNSRVKPPEERGIPLIPANWSHLRGLEQNLE
jgi:hypothetical protein